MPDNQKEEQRPKQASLVIDRRLLEILVCPLTRTTLRLDSNKQELISEAAKMAFPIRDGIPIMLLHETRRLEE